MIKLYKPIHKSIENYRYNRGIGNGKFKFIGSHVEDNGSQNLFTNSNKTEKLVSLIFQYVNSKCSSPNQEQNPRMNSQRV